MTAETTPRIPLEHVTDERLPLATDPKPPDMPGAWVLLLMGLLVILVCVLGG